MPNLKIGDPDFNQLDLFLTPDPPQQEPGEAEEEEGEPEEGEPEGEPA
jgi:hypothetical protein